jgi:hypothetical protein
MALFAPYIGYINRVGGARSIEPGNKRLANAIKADEAAIDDFVRRVLTQDPMFERMGVKGKRLSLYSGTRIEKNENSRPVLKTLLRRGDGHAIVIPSFAQLKSTPISGGELACLKLIHDSLFPIVALDLNGRMDFSIESIEDEGDIVFVAKRNISDVHEAIRQIIAGAGRTAKRVEKPKQGVLF